MKLFEPYLTFDGNCADAMRFYERVFGGRIEMMITWAESPEADQAPPGASDRIMHARLVVDDRVLMASDTVPGQAFEGMKNVWISMAYPTAGDAQRIFTALSDGADVTMPMQKTFWADAFGMLVDRFGTCWMLNGGMQS